MASELARFELEQGGSVVVEVDPPRGTGMERIGRTADAVRDATAGLERALGDVRRAASATLAQFQSMAQRPSEIQLSFGVKIDAQVGAFVAKTGGEANFQVTVTWKPEERPEF
jgi:NTP-dependent ternary system trypsin peptidase co-occuring protein